MSGYRRNDVTFSPTVKFYSLITFKTNLSLHKVHVMRPLKTPICNGGIGNYSAMHYFSHFSKNIDCFYSVEHRHQDGSNEQRLSTFGAKTRTISPIIV